MADNDTFKITLALVAGGGMILYNGFKQRKRVQAIEDIPTSKIDTAPMGDLVEIKGQIAGESELVSPIGGKKCAAYGLKVYEKVKRGKRSSWEHRRTIFSSRFVYIKDGGKFYAALDLANAEINDWGRKINFTSTSSVPVQLKRLLSANGVVDFVTGWKSILSRSYYAQEIVFHPARRVYAIGCAVEAEQVNLRETKSKLNFLNSSGMASERFVDIPKAVNDGVEPPPVPRTHFRESKFVLTRSGVKDIVDTGDVFISFKSERKLIQTKGRNSLLQIFGGAILICAGLYIGITRFLF